jgi:hypothetical protein
MALRLWRKGRPVSRAPLMPGDIDALAQLVEGVDRDAYFDVQAQDAWHDAARRWPLVAEVLGLEARVESGPRAGLEGGP